MDLQKVNYDEKALQAVREDRFLINRYDSWLYEEFEPFIGNRVIEIGCGLGNLLQHLSNKDLVVGIEPSMETVNEARKGFVNLNNIRIVNFSITDPAVLTLADMQFDTALSLNVFEHIEQDELAMHNTWHLLQPGSSFILIVPAHEELYGSMDRSIGHYRRYSKDMLADKMEKAGFQVVRQKYVNILGAIGWWVNGRLLGRPIPPSGQLRLLNVMLPALQAIEQRLSTPLGISLLTIAKKE